MQEVDEVIYSDLFIGGPLAGKRFKVYKDTREYYTIVPSAAPRSGDVLYYTDVIYERTTIRNINRRIHVWTAKGVDVFDELLTHYKP